ncbi:hypothetical protein ACIHDR_48140 [Nocardia sp. NPDC052278]|uniref:hypothetical protein n=1 Tax=unclassified Nocardia TaxID=2637762 RepID=UPI00368BC1E4
MVFAVDARLGVATFEDLRNSKPALTVATAPHDGDNLLGLAGHEMLSRAGIEIVEWGGSLLADDSPFASLERIRTGDANAILHEAVMLPGWQEIASELTFLSVERHVLDGLNDELSWPSAVVPAGYFPGGPEFETLDFSDFLVLSRIDMPTTSPMRLHGFWARPVLRWKHQYRHIPPERSPVTYPLDPIAMGRTPIPLYPGAAAYYDVILGDR